MLMTEIRREKIGTVSVDMMGEALAALAQSAKGLLGYDVLAQQVGKRAGAGAGVAETDSPLRLALRDLGIDVLSERDVVQYQKEMLIARTTEKMREWMEGVAKRAFAECAENGYDRFDSPNWVRTTIKEYREPVPEYVLAKAVQLRERLPECDLIVEHLEDHPDPFLIVGAQKARYGWQKPEEHYYIGVWAEGKFEGRLYEQAEAGGGGSDSDDRIPF